MGLPITDHELPSSFETNIRVVGLTNNFQLVRTFTFFSTIFYSNIRFYHFYEIDYRTRFFKFQATVNSFLLASQKPTYKYSTSWLHAGIHASASVGPEAKWSGMVQGPWILGHTVWSRFWTPEGLNIFVILRSDRTEPMFQHLIWNSKFSSEMLKFLHKTFTYATNLTEYTVRTLSIYTGG